MLVDIVATYFILSSTKLTKKNLHSRRQEGQRQDQPTTEVEEIEQRRRQVNHYTKFGFDIQAQARYSTDWEYENLPGVSDRRWQWHLLLTV